MRDQSRERRGFLPAGLNLMTQNSFAAPAFNRNQPPCFIMKSAAFEKIIALGFATALWFGAAGCASSPYSEGDKTAERIQAAAARIDALSSKIDLTLASLSDLVDKPQADLRPPFKAYSANVKELQSIAQHIADSRLAMGQEGKEFFAEWDKQVAQIQNEDIKARSESRKQEVSKKLMALKERYAEAEIAFRPFLSNLRDVEKFLSIDLTPGGIASVRGPADQAKKHGEELKPTIIKLAEAFKELGLSMSSVSPAAANTTPAPK
jgi:DUF2959 family protein